MENAKKMKVALFLNKYNYKRTLHPEDLAFLKTFADIVNDGTAPEEVDEGYMAKWAADADACITGWGTPPISGAVLEKARSLKLIGHAAGTPKAIVTEAVWEKGIRVFTAAPVIAVDVAETTLGAIIYSLKRLGRYDSMMRSGIWVDNGNAVTEEKYFMRRLNYRLTIGIVGASHVGRNLIRFLKPFGVRIKLFDPYVTGFKAEEMGVEKVSLDELLKTSDVVSIHAPNIPETQGLISREKLALMKDGTLFVNTARGPIADEEALLEELKSGRLNAYLDVYHKEPLPKDSPLHKLENVLLTPHISGGHTVEGGFERGNYVIQQFYSYHTTGILRDETMRDMLKTMA